MYGYEEFYLLEYNAVLSVEKFQRTICGLQ
jgi:hypothetical protein